MAHTILEKTDTTEARVLDKDWAGYYQLLCTAYAGEPVILQVRERDGDPTWLNAMFNGEVIQLDALGAVLDVRFTRDYDYKLTTAVAGSEVKIAKHNLYE